MSASIVVAKDPAASPPRQSGPELVINKLNDVATKERNSYSQPVSFAFDTSNTV